MLRLCSMSVLQKMSLRFRFLRRRQRRRELGAKKPKHKNVLPRPPRDARVQGQPGRQSSRSRQRGSLVPQSLSQLSRLLLRQPLSVFRLASQSCLFTLTRARTHSTRRTRQTPETLSLSARTGLTGSARMHQCRPSVCMMVRTPLSPGARLAFPPGPRAPAETASSLRTHYTTRANKKPLTRHTSMRVMMAAAYARSWMIETGSFTACRRESESWKHS